MSKSNSVSAWYVIFWLVMAGATGATGAGAGAWATSAPSHLALAVAGVQNASRQQSSFVPFIHTHSPVPFTQLSFTACRDAGTDCAEADAAITAVAAMNASFESLFIFLLSKLRLPQVYCEPVDDDKSYIARSITLVRHKKRGTALCRLRAASNFQCVGILPYRSLPTKKNPPHPNIGLANVARVQHRLPHVSKIVKSVGGKLQIF
ncbi:hypothetical protein Y026_4832 [Burkholderia pseudomallei TSV28]|nr:hypothetical protein Y026_4832 [Burkholderia pseudomallei TSV28]KOT10880.1 hypothetical protein DM77_3430 [Burkholderia mallei]